MSSASGKRRRTTQSLRDISSSDTDEDAMDISEYEGDTSSELGDGSDIDVPRASRRCKSSQQQSHMRSGNQGVRKRRQPPKKASPRIAPNSNATKSSSKKESLQQKSPAEFFADNKNIAGFDNPGKCLYTTVRELVENSLDSAESINQLPNVEITIQEMSQKELNERRGVVNMDRVDAALYQDFETEQEKNKREGKHRREMERLLESLKRKRASSNEIEQKQNELIAKQQGGTGKSSSKTMFYKVTVRDNGMGMKHADIPDMLGRVLSGTKYGVKQTRGKFGLGAKMALIWSKMSTGLPIEIYSARPGSKTRSYYKLDIDIRQNLPNVHESAELPNNDGWHGAELSVTISGTATFYRAKILKYLQQIAVITPYAEFSFEFRGEDERNSFKTTFERRTSVMPSAPESTKHHPSSVDLELVKRLIQSTRYTRMSTFLGKEFDCVSKDLAERIAEEMGSGALTNPADLEEQDILRLHQLLHEVRFPDPDGKHLSPAGEYNLRLGVMKELGPEMVATCGGSVGVFEGHAFIVEAAVSIGGRNVKSGINIFRYANRIPLLFEGGSDVITRTAMKRINWNGYSINQSQDKVGVFVSLVSTKIPFKGAGKEYIADDVQEIQDAVKSAIQNCCIQLKKKIVRQQAAREQRQRKKNLVKYIPNVASAVFTVLESISNRGTGRVSNEQVIADVGRGTVTEATLTEMLEQHVERIDMDMAMEYQMQQGQGKKVDMFLVPKSSRHGFSDRGRVEHAVCVISLLDRA
jgi:DNA topoisomerase-6 subunit B